VTTPNTVKVSQGSVLYVKTLLITNNENVMTVETRTCCEEEE